MKVMLTTTTKGFSWSHDTKLWTLSPSTGGNRSYELTCRRFKKNNNNNNNNNKMIDSKRGYSMSNDERKTTKIQ